MQRGPRGAVQLVVVCVSQRAFEPRQEDDIKGMMYGEILGQEMFYNEFDTELIERIMQLGQLHDTAIIGVSYLRQMA